MNENYWSSKSLIETPNYLEGNFSGNKSRNFRYHSHSPIFLSYFLITQSSIEAFCTEPAKYSIYIFQLNLVKLATIKSFFLRLIATSLVVTILKQDTNKTQKREEKITPAYFQTCDCHILHSLFLETWLGWHKNKRRKCEFVLFLSWSFV